MVPQELPASLWQLSSLRTLDLRGNVKLKEIPKWVCKLRCLDSLLIDVVIFILIFYTWKLLIQTLNKNTNQTQVWYREIRLKFTEPNMSLKYMSIFIGLPIYLLYLSFLSFYPSYYRSYYQCFYLSFNQYIYLYLSTNLSIKPSKYLIILLLNFYLSFLCI